MVNVVLRKPMHFILYIMLFVGFDFHQTQYSVFFAIIYSDFQFVM